MEELIKISRISPIKIDEINDDRRINPITYTLSGEWEDGLYVFDDIFNIGTNKISFIIIVNNNKVTKVYKNE